MDQVSRAFNVMYLTTLYFIPLQLKDCDSRKWNRQQQKFSEIEREVAELGGGGGQLNNNSYYSLEP